MSGGINLRICNPDTSNTSTCKIKDCIIFGYSCEKEDIDVWGNKLRFDFPINMTPAQLIENAGGTEMVNEDDGEYNYTYACSLGFWNFRFDENDQLLGFNTQFTY